MLDTQIGMELQITPSWLEWQTWASGRVNGLIGQSILLDRRTGYAFGRLAWNLDLDSEEIEREWVRMTWSSEEEVVEETIVDTMIGPWEALVNCVTPLGLNLL